jgi:hypothetical protein
MRGVIDRQRDQGNWPAEWRDDGAHGELDLMGHASLLRALADYMVVREKEYELNYRYGILWLMGVLSEQPPQRLAPVEIAAGVLALTRAREYWTREAGDVDVTLAAECGERADELASAFRRPLWRRTSALSGPILAAEAQQGNYQM